MMRTRWLFFTLFASFAMPGRFNSIFYAAHSQTEAQVGLLLAAPSMISLLSGPVLCNLADRLRRRELIAGLAHAATTTAFLAQIVAYPTLNLLSPQSRFSVLMALRLVYGCCNAGVYPLVCAIAIAQLTKEHGHKGHERFGEERLFGAISWAVCALVLGCVLDLPNVGIEAIYIGSMIFSSVFLFTLYCFAKQNRLTQTPQPVYGSVNLSVEDADSFSDRSEEEATSDSTSADHHVPSSSLNAVLRIVSSGGISTLLFFNLIFWLAGGMSVVSNLLFLFLQNDLNASNIVCGISVVITVLFEIPLFAYAPRLLRKHGAPALAILGSFSYVVRSVVYSAAPNEWTVLMAEPLHGVTYSAAAMASVAFVADRTPPELTATGQSLLSAIRAFGTTIGAALGGYVMEWLGSKVLYRSAAASVFIAAVLFAASDPASLKIGSAGDGGEMAQRKCMEERETPRNRASHG